MIDELTINFANVDSLPPDVCNVCHGEEGIDDGYGWIPCVCRDEVMYEEYNDRDFPNGD